MIEICFLLSDEFLSCLMNFILLTQITNEQQNKNFECQISIYILKQTSFDVCVCLNKIAKKMNVHYIKKRKKIIDVYISHSFLPLLWACVNKKRRKSFTSLLIANRQSIHRYWLTSHIEKLNGAALNWYFFRNGHDSWWQYVVCFLMNETYPLRWRFRFHSS
jgi:hypothetical protein